MSMDAKIKAYDVYPVAIRAELDAAGIYRDLHERVKNEVLRQKLDFLAKEEDRHKAILERLFRDHFPERQLVVPAESKRPKSKVALDDATRDALRMKFEGCLCIACLRALQAGREAGIACSDAPRAARS